MKKIREITEYEFTQFNVAKDGPIGIFASEEQWFADSENKILGIILKDKIDKDWSYVILGIDEDDTYRAIDVKVSEESIESVQKKLINSMSILTVENGEAKETIFEFDDIIDDSKKLVVTDIDDEIKKYFKKYPEKLYDLSPRKFEELIASIMEDMGFSVELTQATRDGGRDIIANIKTKIWNFLAHIECKKYDPNNKVGVGIIREVVGVHHLRKATKSMIVTTSFFSKDAEKEAEMAENILDLKNYNDIRDWLKDY
ncbi:restriction endonuclease [Flavobacterium sp.]|uniref:restriction endonuclease n=1 Tax=Flavobacterium sp. TaxID=239 RepID=UPI003A904A35